MRLSLGSSLTLYLLTAAVFFAIDLLWIAAAAGGFYQRYLGDLLRNEVFWPAAIAFYIIYVFGVLIFAVLPAITDERAYVKTFFSGAFLGFFAYSTF